MSFSQTVKREILSHTPQSACCTKAAAYGLACFGKYFDAKGLIIHTEQSAVAQYAKRYLPRWILRARYMPLAKKAAVFMNLPSRIRRK